MALLLTLHHRNKENQRSVANGNALSPPCRHRSTAANPYKTRKKVPTPFAVNEAATKSRPFTTVKPTSLSTIEEEEETSPIIKRILEKTGCSSRQELLAMRAAQEANTKRSNTKRSKSTTSVAASMTLNAMNRSKSTTNGSKAATNGSNAANATNGAKATNGSKSTTNRNGSNPKKKAKSKYYF